MDRPAPRTRRTRPRASRAAPALVGPPATRPQPEAADMERVRVLQPRAALTAGARAWDLFWFRPQPTSTLAVLRIAFGLLTMAWAIVLAPDTNAFFGPGGLGGGQRAAPLVVAALFVASAFVAIGFHTRWAAATVLFCLVWLHRVNPLLWNTGDVLLRHLALFITLAPAG